MNPRVLIGIALALTLVLMGTLTLLDDRDPTEKAIDQLIEEFGGAQLLSADEQVQLEKIRLAKEREALKELGSSSEKFILDAIRSGKIVIPGLVIDAPQQIVNSESKPLTAEEKVKLANERRVLVETKTPEDALLEAIKNGEIDIPKSQVNEFKQKEFSEEEILKQFLSEGVQNQKLDVDSLDKAQLKKIVQDGLEVPVISIYPKYFSVKGKDFVEVSSDGQFNTGTKACRVLGGACKGYPVMNNAACLQFNPDAKNKESIHGSPFDYFCSANSNKEDEACAGTQVNTCVNCPDCDNNVTCDEAIGELYDNAYVECEFEDGLQFAYDPQIQIDQFENEFFTNLDNSQSNDLVRLLSGASNYLSSYINFQADVDDTYEEEYQEEQINNNEVLYHENGEVFSWAMFYKVLASKESASYKSWYLGYIDRGLRGDIEGGLWYTPYERWFRETYTNLPFYRVTNPARREVVESLYGSLPSIVKEPVIKVEQAPEADENSETLQVLDTLEDNELIEEELPDSEPIADFLEAVERILNAGLKAEGATTLIDGQLGGDVVLRGSAPDEDEKSVEEIVSAVQNLEQVDLFIQSTDTDVVDLPLQEIVLSESGSLSGGFLEALTEAVSAALEFAESFREIAVILEEEELIDQDPLFEAITMELFLGEEAEDLHRIPENEPTEALRVLTTPLDTPNMTEGVEALTALFSEIESVQQEQEEGTEDDLELSFEESSQESELVQSTEAQELDCSQDDLGNIFDDDPGCLEFP